MKRKSIGLMVICVVVTFFSITAAVPQVSGAELKIGVLTPLTGYVAYFGQLQEAALKVAQKDFAKLGPSGGFDLKFIIYDTGSKPQDAILMAQKLMHSDNVLAIFGPYLSTECEQVFPIVNRDKVPIITASSAKAGLTAANRPWTFRNVMTSDKINEPAFRAWVKQKNIKTVAILTDIKSKVCETYGKEVAPMFLKKYGVRIVEDIDFVTEDVDFSAQITRVKRANPDGIVLAGEYSMAANIAREARKQGLKQSFITDVPTIGTADYIKLGGESVEGTFGPSDFWANSPDPKIQSFVKKFKAELGQDKTPSNTTAAMYDTACITRYLVGKVGLSGKANDLQKDREKIRDGWASLKDYPGELQGKTTIDKNGDALKDFFMLTVKGGQWVKVSE